MKNLNPLFLLMIFAFCSTGYAQSEKEVDSLNSLFEKQKSISGKVSVLADIFDFYLYKNTKKSKQYAERVLSLSTKENYETGIITGNFLNGNYYLTTKENDSAIYYYEKTLSNAKKYNSNLMVASAMANISVIEGEKGNYIKAIKLMDSVAKINLKENDFLNYGVTINNRAYHYYEQGDYLKAMEGYLEAIRVLDTIDRDIYRRADVYRNISKLNAKQNSFEQALEYLFKALEIYKKTDDNLFEAYTLNDIGNTYHFLENHEEAIKYYEKSIQLSKVHDIKDNLVNTYGNLADTYKDQKRYRLALENFNKQQDYLVYDQSFLNRVVGLNQIGETYWLMSDYPNALKTLNTSIKLCDSLNINDELKSALEQRSLVYEKMGNYVKALSDRKRVGSLSDSIYNIEKSKQIEKLQISYETEKKETELAFKAKTIENLNQEVEISNLRNGLYAGGMFTFIAVSGLLYFGFKQRIKKNLIEREKQEAIYKQEIEFKKKELATQTLHLVQKNTFIQELKDNLEKIKRSPELFKVEFRRLVMLLKKESAEDKDWEVFKSYFTEVHNNFDHKIKEVYPDITEKEMRLASFLRMNLSTKEIASMLNVLPESVLKSKYRLKKKLVLDKDTDLNQFLSAL